MNYETSSNSSVGANVYAGVGTGQKVTVKGSLGAGYTRTYQTSNSNSAFSFMDMNNDGLVDILQKGKKYYLKNNGNLEFEVCEINIDGIGDIKRKLKDDIAEKYEKSFFVQTPFRMWKAPYDGIISIKEEANGIERNYERKLDDYVKAETYIGNNKDKDLSFNVFKGYNSKVEKNDVEIKNGDHIYFISNCGKEPSKSDINWNIKIDYSRVKALKNNLPVPYVDVSSFKEKFSSSFSGKKENALKQMLQKLDNKEVLLKLYTVTEKETVNNNNHSFSCEVSFNENYQKSLSEDDRIELVNVLKERNCITYLRYIRKNSLMNTINH